MVGEGDGLLAQLAGAVHELGDAGEAVQQAVLGVKVKVGEHSRRYPAYSSRPRQQAGERLCEFAAVVRGGKARRPVAAHNPSVNAGASEGESMPPPSGGGEGFPYQR